MLRPKQRKALFGGLTLGLCGLLAVAVSILNRDIEPLPADAYDISWVATSALAQAKATSRSWDAYLTLHGQRLDPEHVNAPSQPLVLVMELPSDAETGGRVVYACSDFLLTLREQPSAAPRAGSCTVVFRGEQLELDKEAVAGRFSWGGKTLKPEKSKVERWMKEVRS